jgi:transposase
MDMNRKQAQQQDATQRIVQLKRERDALTIQLKSLDTMVRDSLQNQLKSLDTMVRDSLQNQFKSTLTDFEVNLSP